MSLPPAFRGETHLAATQSIVAWVLDYTESEYNGKHIQTKKKKNSLEMCEIKDAVHVPLYCFLTSYSWCFSLFSLELLQV